MIANFLRFKKLKKRKHEFELDEEEISFQRKLVMLMTMAM